MRIVKIWIHYCPARALKSSDKTEAEVIFADGTSQKKIFYGNEICLGETEEWLDCIYPMWRIYTYNEKLIKEIIKALSNRSGFKPENLIRKRFRKDIVHKLGYNRDLIQTCGLFIDKGKEYLINEKVLGHFL